MAVMNRKLFADRQARNTLRNMGGIMASYPELMQEAQTFQDGGMVTFNQWRNMTRSERIAAGLPTSEIGGQMYFNRFGVGMGTNDPETGAPLLGPSDVDEFGGLPLYMTEPAGTIEAPQPGQGVFPSDIMYGAGEAVGFGPAMERAGIERPSEARSREAEVPAETEMDRLARESAEEAAAAREAAGITDARESIGAAIAAGDQEEAARIAEETRQALEDTATSEEDVPSVPDEPPAIPEDLLANPGETTEDLRSRYADRLKLFQEVLGGADEQTAQDKAMQLAMIGLAIAAGQSPDALTNISQGALAGLTAMSEQEAERRAQDRELRAAALEAAIEDVNLGRRLASSERIAAMRAGVAGEDPRQEYLFNSTFQTTYDYLVNTEGLDPAVAVQRARQAAAEAAPGAPSAMGVAGGVQITPEQDAALRSRIEAAQGDEAQLSAIRNALTQRGLNPSDYGL